MYSHEDLRTFMVSFQNILRTRKFSGKKKVEKFKTHSTCFLHTVHIVPLCRSPNPCLPQQQDTIRCKNLSLTLLKMGKRLPETCWADQ